MKYLITFSLLGLLTACAQAVSQTPGISKAELAAEQQAQSAIIKQEKQRQTSAAEQQNRQQMARRLQQVGQKITQAGQHICQQQNLSGGKCSFPFELDKEDAPVNAYTDGKRIVVSPKMMRFAFDDNQLATVLAHEYAHAVMAHAQKTTKNVAIGGLLGLAADSLARSQGINTGNTFSRLGTQGAVMRYSQDFEREADYIGIYILHRAGYNIHASPYLWRRMATLNPDGIYSASTHPTTAERFLLLEKTTQEIVRKESRGEPLTPERLPENHDKGFLGGIL
jgi:predicted Zn-dependent protease